MTPKNPYFQQVTRDTFLAQPFARLLGLEMGSIHVGQVELHVALEERHLQNDGIVHGGALATLADLGCAFAAHTLIAPGERVVTIEFKVNFLRPVQGTWARCHGQVLRPGKTVTASEARIYADREGQEVLAAIALASIAIIPA